MTNLTLPLCVTADEFAEFTSALERALDCPFIAEDEETCNALERLLGSLQGAADAVAWYQLTTTVPFLFIVMRKIERLMNDAITIGRDFKSGNTQVVTIGDVSFVYLHGNHIASVGNNFVQLFDGGHQSVTTKSRLNAILKEHGLPGEKVFQKGFQWFVWQIGGSIPFFDGMRLA